MVRNVTDRAQPRFITQIEEILATITGPRREFEIIAGRTMQMDFSWLIRNAGESAGSVGLRANLQVDSFFGDVSQLVVEADGSMVGALVSRGAEVSGNFPKTIQPGQSDTLFLTIRVPSESMLDRQGSVVNFSWWLAEITARDLDADELAGGDSRFEVRDWFRLTGEMPPEASPALFQVRGEVAFDVNQLA